MVLNDEQREIVLKNMRLVHYLVNKLGISNDEYDDAISEGLIGLQKAVATFDKTKKIAFATYAATCIKNEIFMYFRKQKKHINNLYLEDSIIVNNRGDELIWSDKIPDSKIDLEDRIEQKENVTKVINIILNLLKPIDKVIMLYKISGITQEEISNRIHISQSYVSRKVNKAIKKVQYYFEERIQYEEVFSMSVSENSYKITFASKDVKNFNKIFATLLQNITTAETLPNFKVTCNKERIVVQIPAHPEAFCFVAKIIQEMEDFSMSYVSDETDLPTEVKREKIKEELIQEEEENIQEEEENIQEEEIVDTEIIEAEEPKALIVHEKEMEPVKNEEPEGSEEAVIMDNNSIPEETSKQTISNSNCEANKKVTKKRGDKCTRIREYMLTLDSFELKDLKEKFSELSNQDISNAIYLAKNKGIITSVKGKKGSYIVTRKEN